ncbi:hypothetical protein [Sinomonas sp. ASV322]|uniref:hypothetical protein n=1 Tax=Sinomonas sp. ASV322 TaxID=3041920 RepID=UPI0027DE48A3|nr:hypothetical protein [Sinomonas sp. ASV322]MDQ4501788.1 hypothetical protein [Sinomonas sp. ASV322]
MSTILAVMPTTPWAAQLAERSKTRFDAAVLRYDAWFLVFLAVILAIGVGLLVGLAIWCVVNQGKNFTGAWQYKDWGVNVSFECR